MTRRRPIAAALTLVALGFGAPPRRAAADEPPPAQYHIVRHWSGPFLTVTGGLLFASSAFLTIGGFTAHDDNDGVARGLGRLGLVGMAVATPMVIGGLLLPWEEVVPDRPAWSLAPALLPRGAGLTVLRTF
jgi:hypothetical protein